MINTAKVSTQLVSSHYNELDLFYREVWGEHLHHGFWKVGTESQHEATEALVRLMIEKLGLQHGMQVCDIGCGYGATSRYLVQHLGCQLQSLSISQSQLIYAKNKSPNPINPKYLFEDWMTNSLDSNSIDAAFSIESSEHMPDFSRFFSECHRVLKPTGKLAVFAWLQSEDSTPWTRTHLLKPMCDEGRMRLATSKEYFEELDKSGFTLLSFDDLSSSVRRTWTICVKRALYKILTNRKYQKFLLSKQSQNRVFVKTIIRIWLAYATGAMNYGLFIAQKK